MSLSRQKKAKKKQEEKELRQQEDENAVGRDPESVEDFERLLLTKGDTSILWIRCWAEAFSFHVVSAVRVWQPRLHGLPLEDQRPGESPASGRASRKARPPPSFFSH